ncbi:bactoprenol glucosyl transferase; CPS-53 (KpLE1) prophage [Legionella busanensis]|uniref:Bactoprenol glucosyl transferase CPS-53 (KpLE1) prophage n=1 Tax=Legionella busanensis TaxID=190655 RepID=A0A378JGG4_9GAMM|nr:glycosyltransferase family 2 protein [Legionella busanensis]STX50214.1 bactoprenol glucosyl transferase; CPS-53 (KpLE1) prophage [Legionella busanensis]
MKYTVIVPVYKNEASIPRLLQALAKMNDELGGDLEVVFVVDGSPDKSYALLREAVDNLPYASQLLLHSRNFGSFPAIRSGLKVARGKYYSVMAADLQEPIDLVINFFKVLESNECDVAIGTRLSRNDPFMSRMASGLFWRVYKRLVVRDMPEGGVDIFGCNQLFRDHLLELDESRSSLIALIFWLGFRRKLVSYERQVREEGKSAWTLNKKIEYMMDSIFAFTDFPIKLLMRIGAIGTILCVFFGSVVLFARLFHVIAVPGYAATVLIILTMGAFNLLGLGLVGTYAWRAYENSKRRPLAIVSLQYKNKLRANNG